MSSMPVPELWPGQDEEIIFNLVQLRALSSVARSEVFWAFSNIEPRSTNEVAVAIRRTSPTVRYHVNELLKANMLLAVETRKRRSRTEEAYVHSFVKGYTPRPPFEKEYIDEMNRGLSGILRSLEKERAAGMLVANEEPSYYQIMQFRHEFLRLGPKEIQELRKKLADLIYEYDDKQDPNGVSIHLAGFMAPVYWESQAKYFELTGKQLAEWEIDNAPEEA
jgi:hypothetical protein